MPTAKRDYYEILGLAKGAGADEIGTKMFLAFQRLAQVGETAGGGVDGMEIDQGVDHHRRQRR